MRHISESKQRIVEGELRCEQLSEYLKKLNLQNQIWLSEDASGIVTKVEYDSFTNQPVGLVLPINSKNGIPIPYTFVPNTHQEIEQFMQESKSSLVYIVMAQPLKENVPPFILQIFGTNNTFTAQNVFQRWQHTIQELEK